MFCADYIISFIIHYTLNETSFYFLSKIKKKDSIDNNSTVSTVTYTKLVSSISISAIAGLGCACVLYPFDFVRMSTVKLGTTHFGYGIVPFTSLYLGLYFWKMDLKETDLIKKLQWALLSTTSGCIAEYPFDYSKQNIFGQSKNWKLGLATNAMRIPLGAFLLIIYDKIYFRFSSSSSL